MYTSIEPTFGEKEIILTQAEIVDL